MCVMQFFLFCLFFSWTLWSELQRKCSICSVQCACERCLLCVWRRLDCFVFELLPFKVCGMSVCMTEFVSKLVIFRVCNWYRFYSSLSTDTFFNLMNGYIFQSYQRIHFSIWLTDTFFISCYRLLFLSLLTNTFFKLINEHILQD